jgi:hypothetical protein
METYQTKLYQARITDSENGWLINQDAPIFASKESNNISEVFHELHAHEPSNLNWIAVLIIRNDGEIVEEDFFHSPLIDVE